MGEDAEQECLLLLSPSVFTLPNANQLLTMLITPPSVFLASVYMDCDGAWLYCTVVL